MHRTPAVPNTLKALAVAVLALAAPLSAQAESSFATAISPATATATARADFVVNIPKFAFLRVGTGPAAPSLAVNGTIDVLTFDVVAANIGNSVAVAATGGDALAGTALNVRVAGNNGNMTVAATTTNPTLLSGADTLAWSEIAVTTSGPVHPTFNGVGVTYNATGKIVNASGTWTYSYLNTTIPPAGSYTGRATYTAVTP